MCLNNDRITSHRLDTFCEFLETTKDESYSKITLDQWRSFLDFSQEFPDEGSLMGYDESESAWPVLIDEYVEFMEKKAKKRGAWWSDIENRKVIVSGITASNSSFPVPTYQHWRLLFHQSGKSIKCYYTRRALCLACLSCSKMYVTDQIWLWQVRSMVLPYNTSRKLPLTPFALLCYRASLICDKSFTDKFKTCPTVLILKWYESREDTFPRRTFSFHPKCQHATLYSLFNHSCLELKERMILLSDHVDKNGSSAENASTYTTLS